MITQSFKASRFFPAMDQVIGATLENSPEKTRIEYLDGMAWDAVAAQFDDAVHEQSHCFNTARWGEQNVENIAFYQNGEIIGGASVIVLKIPLLNTGIAIVKWGPLWKKHGKAENLDRLATVLSLLQEEYAVRRGFHMTVMPTADPHYTQNIAKNLETLGFTTGKSLPAPERYLVNVSLNEDELRQSLSQKWRYNLKKSLKHEFDISFVEDQKGLDEFAGLYATMLKRKKFDDSSAIETLKSLMESKSAAFRPRIVQLSYQGVLTAGAVIDMSGEQAVYLYGATDNRALSLNAGYAIHWFIASFLVNQEDTRWYDLGGNDLDGGLHQFKKGFVGKAGKICKNPPNYHYAVTHKSQLLGKFVFMIKNLKHTVSNISSNLTKRLRK